MFPEKSSMNNIDNSLKENYEKILYLDAMEGTKRCIFQNNCVREKNN